MQRLLLVKWSSSDLTLSTSSNFLQWLGFVWTAEENIICWKIETWPFHYIDRKFPYVEIVKSTVLRSPHDLFLQQLKLVMCTKMRSKRTIKNVSAFGGFARSMYKGKKGATFTSDPCILSIFSNVSNIYYLFGSDSCYQFFFWRK